MNKAQAEELLSDMLAGEIAPEVLDELSEYETENPDFRLYRQNVEAAWGFSMEEPEPCEIVNMSEELKNAISSEQTDSSEKVIKLDFTILDNLAAAGDNSPLADDSEKNPDKAD